MGRLVAVVEVPKRRSSGSRGWGPWEHTGWMTPPSAGVCGLRLARLAAPPGAPSWEAC